MKPILFFSFFVVFFNLAFAQNDNCSGAILISTSGTSCATPYAGTSAGATQSMAGCAGTADDDVWYKFVATATSHTVTVVGSTNYDAVLEAFSGNCSSLSSFGCNDADSQGGTENAVMTGLAIGTTYYFRVYEYSAGSGSNTFDICITSPSTATPPANDDCSGAFTVTSSSLTCGSPLSGTSVNATQSSAGCAGTADDDVWYTFTASSVSHSLSITPSSAYDAVLEVFSGNCSSMTSISCNDYNGQGGIESVHLTGLTPGTVYYFRVFEYGSGSGSGTGTFTICLIDSPPPANDDCSGAFSLSVSTTTACASPLVGSSFGGTESMPGCTGNADDDVWYKFTASAITSSLNLSVPNNFDGVMEVFSGTCGSLNSLNCVDQGGTGGNETVHLGALSPGSTYYVRVYDYAAVGTQNSFTLCAVTPSISTPSNDNCAGAYSITPTPPCTPSVTVFNSAGATQSQSGCSGTADDDVWGMFTATTSNIYLMVTGDATTDAVVELFDGNCSNLSSLQCMDGTGTGGTETIPENGLTVGNTYYFRVYDYGSAGSHTFSVSIINRELNISVSPLTGICLGHSVTLTASGVSGITWSGGISNGVAFTPTVTTTYTATGVGTGSCVNTETVEITVTAPETPSICVIMVDTANVNNVIYWEKYNSNVDSFIVYREVLANVYHRIGAVDDQAFSRFVDTVRSVGPRNGDPNVRSYKYKLQIRDNCGNYGPLSLYHTSLFMNNTGNVFTWNYYDIETQPSPVGTYYIYRDNLNNGNFVQIGTVAGSVNTYTDPAFSTYPSAKWAVFADGFNCSPSYKTANIATTIVRSKSNVKNNLTIPDPPSDSLLTAGLQAYDVNFNTSLIPNPANSYVEIRSGRELQRVNIYNTLGELVYTMNANEQTYLYIRTEELKNGLYHVEFIASNGKAIRKLIITR